MSIRFSMQSIFFNNVPTDHTKECMIYLIESASSLDTNYSISFLPKNWDFRRFCGFAKFFSSAFGFCTALFGDSCSLRVFSNLVFGFRVFDKNDGGCSNFPVQCNLRFFFAKEDPVQTLCCCCCCAQLNSGIKCYATLVR